MEVIILRFNKFAMIIIFLFAALTLSVSCAADNETSHDLAVDGIGEVCSIECNGINNDSNNKIGLNPQAEDDCLGETEIITPANFNEKFGDAIVSGGEYKFEGVFEEVLPVVTFIDGCAVDASEAEFVNMGISLQGDVTLRGLTMTSTHYVESDSGALVYVANENNCLDGLTINYAPESGSDAYAIFINDAMNFTLSNSYINFTGVSLSDYYEYAIKIIDSQWGLIKSNTIIANLPILDVDYTKGEPGLATDLVLNTGIKSSSDLDIIANRFIANVIDRYGDYPTFDCMMLESCDQVNIINNTFHESDFITSPGDANYLNVLDCYYTDNLLVQNNNISVETDGGSENAGTSYPIQLTGPYESVIVDGNSLYANCGGPALGIYSQNYYGDTEILVKNNNIDVTGLPTQNSWGLVSGIELQDTVARVYNNTITTKSVTGSYQEGMNIYGISYAQALKDNHNYDIQNNTVETEGKYAIYLLKAQDLIIANNCLVSSTGEGDSTIYVRDLEGDATINNNSGRKKNETPEKNNVVTPDNFFEFFSEEGVLRDEVTFDELIFRGEFDAVVEFIMILSPITITGDNAKLINIPVNIYSSDVCLNNLKFTADMPLESLIYVDASNVDLINLDISYSAGSENAVAVDIKGDDVRLLNSTIFFESHVPNDEYLAVGVQVVNTHNVVIDSNRITTRLPCVYVNTYDEDYYLMGSNNVNPVRLKDCSNFRFTRNTVNSTTNDYSADFPTIQSIYIIGCSNSIVDHNNISMIDEMTPQGMDNYLYGIDFGYNSNVTFSYNFFNMSTKGGKDAAGTAYAFQGVESEVIIKGNTIISRSNGPNLGIYVASMFGGDSILLIEDNFINVTGYASTSGSWALVSGIEIQNGEACIYNNTIYTYNVNEYDDASYMYGISYAQWMYGTRAFDIQNNTVYTEGKYAVSVIDADYLHVINNVLYAYDLFGNSSVNPGICSDVDIRDNLPNSNKKNPKIQIEIPNDIKVGQNIVIKVSARTTSPLIVMIDGVGVSLVEGKVNYPVSEAGPHTINVFASENDDFMEGNVTRTFDAGKNDACIVVDVGDDVKVGEEIVINVTASTNAQLIVSIDGVEVTLTDGKVIYRVNRSGLHTINVFADENDEYNEANVTQTFNASRNEAVITLNPFTDVKIDDVIVIAPVTNSDGALTIKVNGDVVNGTYAVRFNGTYVVTVESAETDMFTSGFASTSFEVFKEISAIDISFVVARDGDVSVIMFNVTEGACGSVVVNVNGTDYVVNVSDGKLELALGAGEYPVFATYLGDYKFEASVSGTETLTVLEKMDANIVIGIPDDIRVGQSIVINVAADTSSTLVVMIDGVGVALNDGKVIYQVDKAGLHSINVFACENSEFKEVNVTQTFNASKNEAVITLNPFADVKIDDVIVIAPETSSDGALTIKVNGEIVNGTYAVKSNGTYVITVESAETDMFSSGFAETSFEVFKEISAIDISFVAAREGDVSVIMFNVTDGASGRVVVNVNGTEYPVNVSEGKLELTLGAGVYPVFATYLGDYKFDKSVSETETLTVQEKMDANIVINVSKDIKVGQSIVINVTADTTSPLVVSVDGINVTLDDGRVIYQVDKAGLHTINVFACENSEFKEGNITQDFTADKNEAIITLNPFADVKIDDVIVIAPVTNSDGALTIRVNGEIVNGTYAVRSNGTYVVTVESAETDMFTMGFANTSFVVFKETSSINISLVPARAGDISVILFNVTDGASGKVAVNVDGTDHVVNVSDGKLELALGAGEHPVFAAYLGDYKFDKSVSDTETLTVLEKMDANIVISVPKDIKVGQSIVINVAADTSSVLAVMIDGAGVTLSDGKVIYQVIKSGSHVINVFAVENPEFKQANVSQTFNASKNDATISLDQFVDVKIGDTIAIVPVTNSDGALTIRVNGEIVDGNYTVRSNGTYVVTADTAETEMYNSAHAETSFIVFKNNSSVEVTVDAAKALKESFANIKVTDGATGEIIVKLDNTEIYKGLVNETDRVSLGNLGAGNHNLAVTYLGDDYFNSSSDEEQFAISKSECSIFVNSVEITEGEAAKLTISVADDATGKLTVIVDGKATYNPALSNGVATVDINGLSVGKHDVQVIFAGDDRYLGTSINTIVTVKNNVVPVKEKVATKFTAKKKTFKVKTKVKKYTVTLKTSKGKAVKKVKVTLKIKGKTFTAKTNNYGEATFKIKFNKKGTFTSKLSFKGNNDYKATSMNVKITIKK